MNRRLLVVGLVLVACDSEVETWEGNLLARGWDRLPAWRTQPEVRVAHSSQERCNKGIAALENQWKDHLYLLGELAQAQLKNIELEQRKLLGVAGDPTNSDEVLDMTEQIENRLKDDQVKSEHERLGKEQITALNHLEAITEVKNTLRSECRIIAYTELSSHSWLEQVTTALGCLINGVEQMESRGTMCPGWTKHAR
jgi:hypothetical protein